jgi:hypothetical protein
VRKKAEEEEEEKGGSEKRHIFFNLALADLLYKLQKTSLAWTWSPP